jgi:deoxyribodipyrimidine photo-lyase
VRHWVPELRELPDPHVHAPWESGLPGGYPPPIVDHAERRELALESFAGAREIVRRT